MAKLLVAGGGFAGVWAALSAAARRRHAGRPLDIALVSRDPWLTIRPRLYEEDLSDTRVPLDEVLAPADVERIEGDVREVDPAAREIRLAGGAVMRYDRLVVAAGSVAQRPAIPGIGAAFAVDTYAEALALHEHLDSLPARRDAATGRFTAVVIGAGFTGIEVATSLASRMRRLASAAGAGGLARVVLVERAPVLAPDLGNDARRHVVSALADLRVEWHSGTAVTSIETDGVRLAGNQWIPAATVVLTGGFRASPLAAQLSVERDALGRLSVDEFLRVRGLEHVYAAGDVARAVADPAGHIVPMSCQCAIPMGEVAGANAAADLLGGARTAFTFPDYVTCLDLGDAGALFMEGWEREVRVTGFWARLLKEAINTRLIYPPRPGHIARPANELRPAA